jgi:4'-phosphopantetheinyl transferase
MIHESGKPTLAVFEQGKSSLQFNISHSGDLGVVAVAANMDIGVDLQRIDPGLGIAAVARKHFCEAERAWASETEDDAEARRRVYSVWARKEACLKALGLGISIPLAHFSVVPAAPLDDPGLPQLVNVAEGRSVYLRELETEPGYALAVACTGPIAHVRVASLNRGLEGVSALSPFDQKIV